MVYLGLFADIREIILFVNLPDQGSQEERGNPRDGLSPDLIPPILLQSI